MFRQIFARSNLTALALLGALLVAEPARAQQGWYLYDWSGGWGTSSVGSFYRGGYEDFEYAAPSYATPGYYTFSGFSPSGPVTGFQSFFAPRIAQDYGYFSSTPNYYTFSGFSPSGSMAGYQSLSVPQIAQDYGYFSQDYGYFGPSVAAHAAAVNQAVLINVSVPAHAEISFEGEETAQTGAFRQFVSPSLVPGREYTYHIEVRWTEAGMEATRSRRVTVHAGDVVNLSFHSGSNSANSVP
jgi:uncharacterized protein (TIGR03000 family)